MPRASMYPRTFSYIFKISLLSKSSITGTVTNIAQRYWNVKRLFQIFWNFFLTSGFWPAIMNAVIEMKKEIGSKIKFYRKKAGLSQIQLAEKLNVTNRAVSNWESGANGIDIELIPVICEALNVRPNDLMNTPAGTSDNLYISRPSGNPTTDELRKHLHDLIDQLDDESLRLLNDVTIRFKA